MSLFARSFDRVAPARLDYPTLVAGLRAGIAADALSAFTPQVGRTTDDDLDLADILLARRGWRDAALARGGCFAPAAR